MIGWDVKLTLGVDDTGSDFPGVPHPRQDGGGITNLSGDIVIICPFTQISKLGMVAHTITTALRSWKIRNSRPAAAT